MNFANILNKWFFQMMLGYPFMLNSKVINDRTSYKYLNWVVDGMLWQFIVVNPFISSSLTWCSCDYLLPKRQYMVSSYHM